MSLPPEPFSVTGIKLDTDFMSLLVPGLKDVAWRDPVDSSDWPSPPISDLMD